MAGWVEKKTSSDGNPKKMMGFGWKRRYLVLLRNNLELKYFGGVKESRFGNVPLDERASIPIESILRITVPQQDDFDGRRFDVHIRRIGSSKFPRAVTSAAGAQDMPEIARTLSMVAPDVTTRHEWVTSISAFLEERDEAHETTTSSRSRTRD